MEGQFLTMKFNVPTTVLKFFMKLWDRIDSKGPLGELTVYDDLVALGTSSAATRSQTVPSPDKYLAPIPKFEVIPFGIHS